MAKGVPNADPNGGTLKRMNRDPTAMEIRGLAAGDGPSLREIAHRSLMASYDDLLGQRVIEEAVESWYGDDAVATYLAGEEMEFLIAAEDGKEIGFAQSHVVEDLHKGRILWIHVDPAHRERGVGTRLLDRMTGRLHDRGIDTVSAVVLASHAAGIEFYESRGFEPLATRTVTIADQEYEEVVLREQGIEYDPLEMRLTPDGDEVFIDFDESDRGSLAPFCAVYRDPHRERRWGWFCTGCESFATSMDTMGRIQCNDCGNTRQPTRWDAAYL